MIKAVAVIALLFAGGLLVTEQTLVSPREQKIQQEVCRQITSFHQYVKDSLYFELGKQRPDTQRVRQYFLQARWLFKKFEWAAEYFAADLTKRINGVPVQEIENADLLDPTLARGVDPMGLQVMEQAIFPIYDTTARKGLVAEAEHLIKNTDYLGAYFSTHELADWRILDAAKLEVFRIITLGITGFDNGLSLNSMQESAASLQSLREVLFCYVNEKKDRSLLQHLDAGIEYINHHNDFNAFDRAVFITRFANKISTGIAELEQELPGKKIRYNRMLVQQAKTLFDSSAFNADAFSPGPAFRTTAGKVLLGQKLFSDPSLSGTGMRSCASCHNPALVFTDGLAKQQDIHHPDKLLLRNTPTLLNAALQSNYFYDMRALTLEDQVSIVMSSQQEMDASMEAVIKKLATDKTYQALLIKAYPGTAGNMVTPDEVSGALASYVRSLVRLNSRFDDYMRGNMQALSGQELAGFNLFTGKAKCATCHFVPLFNGVTPPKYVESETEVIGVPVSLTDSACDADPGYYGIMGVDSYKHAFKIPSVRNSTKTAPYMHNGVYQTLDQVMEFYNNGGGAGLGMQLPNQTLPAAKLGLTRQEKNDIIAFMGSLESR